jgi:hypothetical protein
MYEKQLWLGTMIPLNLKRGLESLQGANQVQDRGESVAVNPRAL